MREFSIIKKNILKYLDFKGVSKYEFYSKTGISNGILSQSNGISEDNILKFLSYYRDINVKWLITGEGEMMQGSDNKYVNEPVLKYQKTKKLPLIPLSAVAGLPIANDVSIVSEDCEYYDIPEFNKKADYLIRVTGSSMSPKYNSGDIVACKKLPLDTFFQWNKVYLLDTEQGPLIKRIKKSENKGSIILVSDNIKYDPFEIELTSINSLAIVIGVIRLE
jgi:phage repressor protein C with HTH and peptisase S24 domain